MDEPADGPRAVQLDAAFFEGADEQHLVDEFQQVLGLRAQIGRRRGLAGRRTVVPGGFGRRRVSGLVYVLLTRTTHDRPPPSNVEVSPSGNPCSRARSRRRITF